MLKALKLNDLSERSSISFWLCLAFLFLVVLAFQGKTVPFNNEFIYLLRLQPGFLSNDWSFSQSANEHWLFNLVFSLPAKVLSIEVIGWIGRVTFWGVCLAALLKLGKSWALSYWAIAFSIAVWLACGQTVVNAEWIFGGFEAKPVAYACLLFALVGFSKQKIIAPSILLGLSFSFHPAIGLWAIPAVGLALLIERVAIPELVKVVGLTFLFSLPGLLPLLTEQTGAVPASFDDWQFVVTKLMPYHFDPFFFLVGKQVVLGLMLAFNLAALWKSEHFAIRFIRNFQIAIAGFFILGYILRALDQFPLLRLMPMRLFPILTPIFFLFTAFYLVSKLNFTYHKIAAGLFVVLVIGSLHPFQKGFDQMYGTRDTWRAKPDDLETSYSWISKNTPKDAVIIVSPYSRNFWYLAQRAQIVSYYYPRYERLPEWRQRIADLTGIAQIANHESSETDIGAAFEKLSVTQVAELKQKYSANYLISRTAYPFPVVSEAGNYKIYQLP